MYQAQIDGAEPDRGQASSGEASPAGGQASDGLRLTKFERDLAAVESAMVRLDDGTYGMCEVCHRPLSDDILVRDATAGHCGDHLPLGI